MDKKFIQSKLRNALSEMKESPVEEANYIVKADDIDKVGDKLEAKLDDDDVVKVVDEAELVDCPCNGKCKKGSKCKPVEESSEEENNPWAICTASVGREDKEKYESCVRQVKKEYGIKESVRPKMTKAQLIESVIRNSKTIFTVKDFISENTKAPITLNGQKIDISSVEIDGIDKNDYPDFVDAYFSYAEYDNGMPLTNSELDKLTDEYSDLVSDLIHSKQLFF